MGSQQMDMEQTNWVLLAVVICQTNVAFWMPVPRPFSTFPQEWLCFFQRSSFWIRVSSPHHDPRRIRDFQMLESERTRLGRNTWKNALERLLSGRILMRSVINQVNLLVNPTNSAIMTTSRVLSCVQGSCDFRSLRSRDL